MRTASWLFILNELLSIHPWADNLAFSNPKIPFLWAFPVALQQTVNDLHMQCSKITNHAFELFYFMLMGLGSLRGPSQMVSPCRGCSIVLLFSPILIQAPIMHAGKALFTIGSSRTDSPEYETSFQKTFTSNHKPCAVFSLDTVSMKCCWRISQSEAQWAGEQCWLTLTWERWIESGPGQTRSLYCPLSHHDVPAHWRYKPHKLRC